jgi:hypothetical protein
MLILFSLIVMRMSGAIALNPMFGRTNLPSAAKAGFVFLLSLLLYTTGGAGLYREPATMLEYGIMLLLELFVGFTLGFAMELSVMVVRFASSAMDYVMGLNMAQIYDPQYNTQMTITSGMYYAFLMLLFFAMDGHLRLLEIFYGSGGAHKPGAGNGCPGHVQAEHCHGASVCPACGGNGTGCGDRGGHPHADHTADKCVCGQLPGKNHRGHADAPVPVFAHVGQIIWCPGLYVPVAGPYGQADGLRQAQGTPFPRRPAKGRMKVTGPGKERGIERNKAQNGTGHRKGVRDSGREQRTGKDRKTNQ